MKVFGITGGIGMGKSTAAQFAEQFGLPVADTDAIAREIVQPGQPALEQIKNRFGNNIVGQDGRLRREELARCVFTDCAARRELESILHPRIREIWRRRVEQWRSEGRSMAAVVIPLLFETGAEKHVDATICVACSAATQRERLLARGWTDDQIRQRIAAQWAVQKKIDAADYVVWSEGQLEVHRLQLKRIVEGGG